ncbi:RNA polymerase sigma factor [Novispirillum sp. DQ9]|uniref:RNA polymerase sigma factor n=1 Tax=Novispirillum sp. DQ9 TaxID=3398612 RepID=UPI003C7E992D
MTAIDLSARRETVRRFVLRLVGVPDLADDIVQETMLRAMSSAAGFAGRAKPDTWLSAIALNVLRDHWRKPASRAEHTDASALDTLADDHDVVLDLMKAEMGSCIAGHLMALPDRHRQILALHDMGGAGHAEIARIMGIGEGNARVLLHRARAALRARLSGYCDLDLTDDEVPCAPRQGAAS